MKLITQINKLLPYLKKPSNINTFHNVLVVSNTGLGDTILSTPAIISLRNSFPEINITFMVNKKMFSTRDLLNGDNFQLIEAGSVQALVDAISFYLDGNNLNHDRSFIIKHYSKAVMSKKIVHLYHLLLA